MDADLPGDLREGPQPEPHLRQGAAGGGGPVEREDSTPVEGAQGPGRGNRAAIVALEGAEMDVSIGLGRPKGPVCALCNAAPGLSQKVRLIWD